jgi:hypothetical protein
MDADSLSGAQDDLKEAKEHIDDAQDKLEEMAAEKKEHDEGEVELHKLMKQDEERK